MEEGVENPRMRWREGVDGAGLGDRLRLIPIPEEGGLEATKGALRNISDASAVLNVRFCCSLCASVSIGVCAERRGVGGRGSEERL